VLAGLSAAPAASASNNNSRVQGLQLARQANKGYLGVFGDHKSHNRAHKSTLELDLVASFDSVLERASSFANWQFKGSGHVLQRQLLYDITLRACIVR
jgi:hypothetical protein